MYVMVMRKQPTGKMVPEEAGTKQLLTFIIRSLQFIGGMPSDLTNLKRLKTNGRIWCRGLPKRSFCFVIITLLYLVQQISLVVYTTIKSQSLLVPLFNGGLSRVIKLFVHLVTTYKFLRKPDVVDLITRRVLCLHQPLDKVQEDSLIKLCNYITCTGWIYVVVSTISIIIGVFYTTKGCASEFVWFRLSNSGTVVDYILCLVDRLGFNTVLVYSIFYNMYYVCLCIIVSKKIENLNQHIRNAYENYTLHALYLRKLHQQHTVLYELVQDLDDIFNKLVFLWYTDMVMNMIYYFPKLIRRVLGLIHSPIGHSVVESIKYLYMFMMTTLVASRIQRLSGEEVVTVQRIFGRLEVSEWESQIQANYLLSKLIESKICMTGWNFFTITKGFMLTVLGGVLTFIVIFLQI